MKRLVIGLLAAGSLCGNAERSAAQETAHPMYLIRQEFVKPALMADYETETARWLYDLAASETSRDLQWVTVYGPELGYAYVVPIEGLTGIDRVRSNIAETRGAAAARWASKEGPTPIERVDTSVLELRPDLSYLPRTVALNLELPFRKYHWYHVIPGMESAFEAVARRIVELYGEHGVAHGYRFYEYVIGNDMPMYVLVERANDEADYAARTQRIRDTVGFEAEAMFSRLLALSRGVDVMEGTVLGALSFPQLEGGPTLP